MCVVPKNRNVFNSLPLQLPGALPDVFAIVTKIKLSLDDIVGIVATLMPEKC